MEVTVARQPAGEGSNDKSREPSGTPLDATRGNDADPEEDTRDESGDVAADMTGEDDEATGETREEAGRSAEADEFWSRTQIEPVEIALPGGLGYTLKSCRLK